MVNYGPPKLIGGTVGNLLGKYKIDDGMFYKSITGLAYGCYAIKLIQLDKYNEELIKTEAMFFVIR